ncbi:hypothetical protein TSMEX_001963 [Taenia solium]|eukprot:TsM_000130100 transcript=TsM_000130100 gene=TsM_000130100
MHPAVSIVAVVMSIFFLILALAIPKWPCGGNIFDFCSKIGGTLGDHYLAIGVLLIIAVLLLFVVLVILLVVMFVSAPPWVNIIAAVISAVASIFAVAAVLLYTDKASVSWSPFMAIVGTTVGIQITVMLILALIFK